MAGYASQSTLRLLIVGLVCIAAIAVGAATITSTVGVESGPSGPIFSDVGEDDDGDERPVEDDDSDGGIDITEGGEGSSYYLELEQCNEYLDSIPGTAAYFAAFFGVIYLLKRRYSLGTALIGSYALAPVALMVYFLNTVCTEPGAPPDETGGIINGSTREVVPTPEISPLWLIAIFGLLLVAAAAVVVRASGNQTVEIQREEEREGDGTDVADLAAAAGAAADRLEEHNADVDNAVYRAWWEMTRLLEVENPDSATPGEFAEAAIELGMGEDHVDELTRLFEEVRYGQRDPDSREALAIEVFREIEDEYGREDGANLEGDDGY